MTRRGCYPTVVVDAPARDAVRLISPVAPEVARLLEEAVQAALAVPRGDLVELAGRRVAMLLGGDSPTPWPPLASFSDAERACLAVAEQFAIDVGGMTDADISGAAAHLSTAELYGFVAALYTLELTRRVEIALAAVLEGE
jgi:hypothetical protein